MSWSDLLVFAPHTKSVFESLSKEKASPVHDAIPNYLNITDCRKNDVAWGIELDRTDAVSGISNREVLLRYVLSRAIVDQGSDIDGVEMWHSKLLARCYERGIRVLHSPADYVSNYSEVLSIGVEVRDEVVAARAQVWASQKKSRYASWYTPFNVDGQRGGKQAHWFMSARLFPALLLAQAQQGGLSKTVFGDIAKETPLTMSRRLRNDPMYGLGYCIGDKACDLFSKWAIGTYRLGSGIDQSWDPADSPLPMDQRIGRLMIRFGFMDEFFGVSRMMSAKTFGFNPEDGQTRPVPSSGLIPYGRWFLRVMDFRRNAKVRKGPAMSWLNAEWLSLGGIGNVPKFGPQEVIGVLCKSMNRGLGISITPVEIDDQLMRLGGTYCTDNDPDCSSCDLASTCQANTDLTKVNLKFCYT